MGKKEIEMETQIHFIRVKRNNRTYLDENDVILALYEAKSKGLTINEVIDSFRGLVDK